MPVPKNQMSVADWRALEAAKGKRKHKYGSVRTEVDGHKFDSRKEAARWAELNVLERAGLITGLAMQVPFPIEVNGQHVCTYLADFCYQDAAGARVVEDVKGVRTQVYRLKKKLVEATYGIRITEL